MGCHNLRASLLLSFQSQEQQLHIVRDLPEVGASLEQAALVWEQAVELVVDLERQANQMQLPCLCIHEGETDCLQMEEAVQQLVVAQAQLLQQKPLGGNHNWNM